MRLPVALTIAGSDSGGGAGIQADLKTFAAMGVHGTAAITAITAQNTVTVTEIHEVPVRVIRAQIDAVVEDIGVQAAKTGMLASSEIIEAVAAAIEAHAIRNLVVDPVMVAKGGARLLQSDAIAALYRYLLPLAAIVTPNLPEAEVLLGGPPRKSLHHISHRTVTRAWQGSRPGQPDVRAATLTERAGRGARPSSRCACLWAAWGAARPAARVAGRRTGGVSGRRTGWVVLSSSAGAVLRAHIRPMLLRERTDTVADAVRSRREGILARLNLLYDLMPPVAGVGAAGDRRFGGDPSDRERGHGETDGALGRHHARCVAKN